MEKKENNGGNSGHYVVASRPPNGDRLQRRRSCQKHKTLWWRLKYSLKNPEHFEMCVILWYSPQNGTEFLIYPNFIDLITIIDLQRFLLRRIHHGIIIRRKKGQIQKILIFWGGNCFFFLVLPRDIYF